MNRYIQIGKFFTVLATILFWAVGAVAQTVVVGTGSPDTDIKAVQAAVDKGGEIVLKGHFSFNKAPTIPTATTFVGGMATILVSRAVRISGQQDDDMATIEGGTTPFYVDAPGAKVTIEQVRFVRPIGDAIFAYAVNGLVIDSCKIEGVEVLPAIGGSEGIDIATSGGIPTPTNPGKPGNVSGTLLIVKNEIDLAGGTSQDNTIGLLVFSVGAPGAEVDAYISGNTVKNTTEPAINIRHATGRVYVENNVIATGSVVSQNAPGPEAIRVANTGSYVVAHNKIDCQWNDPDAKGIGVFSQFSDWPLVRATVEDNDLFMGAPAGTVFGTTSAGVNIRGFSKENVVLNNRIRGHAWAALSVDAFKGGIPDHSSIVINRFEDFHASNADVSVGNMVTNTQIAGAGTVADQGIGTIIDMVPF